MLLDQGACGGQEKHLAVFSAQPLGRHQGGNHGLPEPSGKDCQGVVHDRGLGNRNLKRVGSDLVGGEEGVLYETLRALQQEIPLRGLPVNRSGFTRSVKGIRNASHREIVEGALRQGSSARDSNLLSGGH